MARPTSFRLPEDLLVRLDDEARASGSSVTALVASLLDEGLKTRCFPGIVYRDGATSRRAGLVGGPDVWEVIRDLRHTPGKGMRRIERLAADTGVPAERVRLAVDFYSAHSDEVDRLVAADEQVADRARRMIEQRERLLSA